MPLAESLSLAAAIFQFVDRARAIAAWSYEIYSSADGLTEINERIEKYTLEIQHFSQDVAEQQKPEWIEGLDKEDQDALQDLANTSKYLAENLLKILEKLKVERGGSKARVLMASIVNSLRSVGKRGDISGLQKEIDSLSDQITRRFVKATVLVRPHPSRPSDKF